MYIIVYSKCVKKYNTEKKGIMTLFPYNMCVDVDQSISEYKKVCVRGIHVVVRKRSGRKSDESDQWIKTRSKETGDIYAKRVITFYVVVKQEWVVIDVSIDEAVVVVDHIIYVVFEKKVKRMIVE